MRKRSKLGLAEPLLTNRFLLWGIGAGSSVSLLILSLSREVMRQTLPVDDLVSVTGGTAPIVALCGFSCAMCYLFAFAPARWYVRRIEGASDESRA